VSVANETQRFRRQATIPSLVTKIRYISRCIEACFSHAESMLGLGGLIMAVRVAKNIVVDAAVMFPLGWNINTPPSCESKAGHSADAVKRISWLAKNHREVISPGSCQGS